MSNVQHGSISPQMLLIEGPSGAKTEAIVVMRDERRILVWEPCTRRMRLFDAVGGWEIQLGGWSVCG